MGTTEEHPTFCPLPWISMYVRSDASVSACCVSQNLIQNKQSQTLKFDTASMHELINSDSQKKLRTNLLNKIRPSACMECFASEDLGNDSLRKSSLERFQKEISVEEALQVTDSDGTIAESLSRRLDIQLGNYCNLRCRMCDIGSSSSWYSDHYALRGESDWYHAASKLNVRKENGSLQLEQDPFVWALGDAAWDRMQKMAEHATNAERDLHLNLQGGEPLLHPKHLPFLRSLVERGFNRRVHLSYVTNLTHLPSEVMNLWGKFASVAVGVSIDGVRAVNDYIRYPSRFEKIEGALESLIKDTSVQVWVQPSISAFNIYYLPELFEWAHQRSEAWARPVIVGAHFVFHPSHLHPSVLPVGARHTIATKLRNYLKIVNTRIEVHTPWWIGFQAARSAATLKSSIALMESPAANPLFSKFLEEVTAVDKVRNQQVATSLPELWKLVLYDIGTSS
jgi:hypothetical protein